MRAGERPDDSERPAVGDFGELSRAADRRPRPQESQTTGDDEPGIPDRNSPADPLQSLLWIRQRQDERRVKLHRMSLRAAFLRKAYVRTRHKAKEFDRKFDSGEDVTKYLDLTRVHRPAQEQKRVNVDFPLWMVHSLDKEAKRLGVPRRSLIKVLIAQHLEKVNA